MQPNIDMSAIREALMRRLQGGSSMPAASQMSSPEAPLPTGGANTPTVPAPTAEMPGSNMMPAAQDLAKSSQVAQGPAFDQETREASKVLLKKLIQYL